MQGIYKIESRDGKTYIGSGVSIEGRWRNHIRLLRQNQHWNKHLQNTWNKHGSDYFTFNVIELVTDRDKLVYYEQLWLDILFTSLDRQEIYNISTTAYSCRGVKRSTKTKQLMSSKLIGNKRGCGKKGYKMPDESKNKLREANLGKKYSDATNKAKGRKGRKQSSNCVYVGTPYKILLVI